MPDASVGLSATCRNAPFCEPANAGLEELVGGDPEEIRHAIQVGQLHLPRALQELVDRRRVTPEGERQRRLVLATAAKQFLNIFSQLVNCPESHLAVRQPISQKRKPISHSAQKIMLDSQWRIGFNSGMENGWIGRERLAQWLQRAKVNQLEAAELIGIDKTQLSQILTGKRRPGLDNAIKIERATGIAVEAWVPLEEDKTDGDDSAVVETTPVGKV